MAAVVTFWRFPDEEERFLRYVVKTGDIWACTGERVTDVKRLEPRPIIELIREHDPDAVLFGPREFMDRSPIKRYEHEGEIRYGRYFMNVPLISYTRGRFRSPRELGLSNMCAEYDDLATDEHDPECQYLVRRPEAFIKWVQRVFAWIRRDTPKWHQYKGYRVTERVAEEIAKGLEIVP
jgi:hypothetical protein